MIAGRLIQGAAGSTILACGLSLLTVANSGPAQVRAVSLWGAAAAVGAAAGPLVGGVLVDVAGWQGLFWIDAAIAVLVVLLTAADRLGVARPDRPPTIDYAGSALVALTLAPLDPRAEQGQRLGLAVARHRSAASWCRCSRASGSSLSSDASRSRSWTWPSCATGCSSGRRWPS